MRADRLIATLLVLQSRGRVTAAELAAELEVSVATARRDLEALGMAGIPVYPQRGRGGGWALVGGARTDLTGLTEGEAQALFRRVGPAATGSDAAEAALRKLLGAVPASFRAEAEAAARATVVDPTRWGERARARPPLVDELETAVVAGRRVRLVYTSGARERSERLVDPWGLVAKDDTWYLIAGTDRGQRTFRVDRIASATPTAEQGSPPPAGFALAEAWDEVVGVVEATRSETWATVLIASRFVAILGAHFGRHCHVTGEADDGRAEVRLGAPTPLDIARNLAGWGGQVEVLDPPAVRRHLARLAAEVTALYGDDDDTGRATATARARGRGAGGRR